MLEHDDRLWIHDQGDRRCTRHLPADALAYHNDNPRKRYLPGGTRDGVKMDWAAIAKSDVDYWGFTCKAGA